MGYVYTHIRFITKLFTTTKLKVAFRTTNTIENFLQNIQTPNKNGSMGIYKLTYFCAVNHIEGSLYELGKETVYTALRTAETTQACNSHLKSLGK
jgi:hypothetical protein